MQKNILGLVQGPPCRIDVDFKDERGHRYRKTAVVKGKSGEAEEVPLFTNHDTIVGEVRASWRQRTCGASMPCACSERSSASDTHASGALPQVRITPLTTKRVEHSGIKVQLLGQIELASERATPHDFVSLGGWRRAPGACCAAHDAVARAAPSAPDTPHYKGVQRPAHSSNTTLTPACAHTRNQLCAHPPTHSA